jgi:outer membrane receptor for Fe3+-dicitrate
MHRRSSWLTAVLMVLAASAAAAQGRVVQGTVTDSLSGAPLSNVRITVAGTGVAGRAADDGTFQLAGLPVGAVTITFRAIGYRTKDVTLRGGQNQTAVGLVREVFQLDEVVVTGQATGIARRNLPNAVATVNSQDVERVSAQSIEHAIQGKVAGADIQTNSGAPGGGVQVRMRGVTSINASATWPSHQIRTP